MLINLDASRMILGDLEKILPFCQLSGKGWQGMRYQVAGM